MFVELHIDDLEMLHLLLGLPPIKVREFYSLVRNSHKTYVLHLENEVSKHKLQPLTKIGPLGEDKNPKTLFGRLSAVFLHSELGFELMGPRSTTSIL